MKIKTITADSVNELDGALNVWLENSWELLGDMQVYKEKHNHFVHGYEIWDNKFAQRIKKEEPKYAKGGIVRADRPIIVGESPDCTCPAGMKYHANNCLAHPGELQTKGGVQ